MIAYNLNVISAETRHDFGIIKDIRNTFSHTYLPISFKTDKISTKCNNLKLTTDIKPPLSKHIKDDSRGRYIKSVVTIMSFLVSNMILSKHEKALLKEHRRKRDCEENLYFHVSSQPREKSPSSIDLIVLLSSLIQRNFG